MVGRKAVWMTAGLTVSSLVFSIRAEAASFSQIYAVGDSLSDTGNTSALTNFTVPPSPPYADGRLSNGLIWTEYLAADLGIPLNTAAFAGATTGEAGLFIFNGQPVTPVPGLLSQVNSFIAGLGPGQRADSDALYTLWAGANDYLFLGNVINPQEPITNLTNAIALLSSVGAENFLVVNLPDLGETPLVDTLPDPGAAAVGLNSLTEFFNTGLAQSLNSLGSSSDLNLFALDVNTLFDDALAGNFGFSNTSQACVLVVSCVAVPEEQNNFLFWDLVHPTTKAHRIIADEALVALEKSSSVPEPGLVFGLLVLGVAGAVRTLRKG